MSTGARPARGAGIPAPAVLTFLIADVRGYTAFTREHGDDAAARLAATFAEIVREGVEAHEGSVIELRGDEALAAFASSRQALRAAAALQRVFADETALHPALPLGVGIGVDSGEAVPVEDGFRGGALNLAARLCARAAAGETLVSAGVVHLAGTVADLRIVPAGELELKGMASPVAAFAVRDELAQSVGATGETPVVAGRASAPLPPELEPVTPLVGRDREARSLRWAWREARRGDGRVVVLTGPAGSGRTRLAAEAAIIAAHDGALVRYISFGPARRFSRVLDELEREHGPAILVLDDLDRAGDRDVARLRRVVATSGGRRLVVGTVADDHDSAVVRRVVGADVDEPQLTRLALRGLDEAGVAAVCALYAGEDADAMPVRAIAEASAGLPARVHELASRWASGEAARRLGENVSRAAAGRRDLREIEAEVSSNVIDLQLARERVRLYTGTPTADDPDGDAPFKGLASFEVSDAARFFGRERLVAELVGRLAGTTFLGIVGSSGSGKSSAVMAGLLPALRAGVLPGSAEWIPVVMRPGSRPTRELDRAVFGSLPEAMRTGLRTSDDPLAAAAEVLDDEAHLLVIVDQFEEVFTTCSDEDDRRSFLDGLVAAASLRRAVVVAVVRADFYGRCAEHPALARLLAENHVLVGPMTATEYRRAITQPAARAGAAVEPELVDALLADVADEPGGLPLLSTALLELWGHRDGRSLTAAAYAATGGVRGAVARLAETAYARLSESEGRAARAILLRLSSGEGESAVRRRIPLAELDASTNPDVATALAVLTDARLVTTDDGSVDIAHEALLREWPRLVGWLEEDAVGRRLREHLTEAARAWASSGRDASELYRGARLASAVEWTADHAVELNDLEREFLAESRAVAGREEDRQRRTNRRLRMLLAGVGVLTVASLVAGGFAVLQRGEAERAAATAGQERAAAQRAALVSEAQRLGVEGLQKDLDLSLLLARLGVQLDDSAETRTNLLAAVVRSPQAMRVFRPLPGRLDRISASSDGRRLLVRAQDGSVAVVDAQTGTVIHAFAAGEAGQSTVTRIAGGAQVASFASDGTVMFLRFDPRRLEFYEPATGRQIEDRLTLIPSQLNQVSWSPDGSQLTTIESGRQAIDVLSARSGKTLRRLAAPPGKSFLDVTQYAGGQIMTLLHDGPVPDDAGDAFDGSLTYAWWLPGDTTPRTLIPREAGPDAWPWAVSPDLKTFALGRRDGSVTLYDLATGKGRALTGRHSSEVTNVGFSDDSRLVISTGRDRAAIVWDPATGGVRDRLIGHNGEVLDAAFGGVGDGTVAYTVGADGALITWNLSGRGRLGRPFNAGGALGRAATPNFAISADGRLLAVPQDDGSVVVRDATSLGVVHTIAREKQPVLDVAFSPDSQRLAVSGFGSQIIAVYDTQTWQSIPGWRDVAHNPNVDAADGASAVAFSPDGTLLALGSDEGEITLWNTRTGQRQGQPLVAGAEIWDIAFSPRGDLLAATANSGIGSFAIVWRMPEGAQAYTVDVDVGHAGTGATGVSFSPDGLSLATSGGTGEVEFWDAYSGAPRGRSPVSSGGWLMSARYHPTTNLMVTADQYGAVRLLDGGSRTVIGPALPGVDNTPATALFSADGKRVFVVYGSGAAYVWDATLDSWMARACAVAGRGMTEAEWSQYVADRPYQPVCP